MNAYAYPRTLSEALAVLAEHPAALVMGGGTMVMPRLASGELSADVVLDVSRIPELSQIRRGPAGDWILGAAVTYRQILGIAELPWLLRTAAAGITGGPQILAQGTIGGSASYANPASDMPGVLVALDASMVIDGVRGLQDVPARDFFKGAFATAITGQDVLLREIRLPSDRASGSYGYLKIKMGESSWPIVTAAAQLADRAETGKARQCRVTIGGAAEIPFSCVVTTDATLSTLHDAVESVAPSWVDDVHASANYRRRITPAIAQRAMQQAIARSA